MGMSKGARREVRSATLKKSSCIELIVRGCPVSPLTPSARLPSASQPRLRHHLQGSMSPFSHCSLCLESKLLAREGGRVGGKGHRMVARGTQMTHKQELIEVHDFLWQERVEELLSLQGGRTTEHTQPDSREVGLEGPLMIITKSLTYK